MTPPVSPTTLAANGKMIDNYLSSYFAANVSPIYWYLITSGYRDKERNQQVGGVEDSAHLYNLARDFVIVYANEGKVVPEEEAKAMYNDSFRNWNGYTYFEPASAKQGYHIHVNLPRDYSKVGTWLTASLWIGAGLIGGRWLLNWAKGKKKNVRK